MSALALAIDQLGEWAEDRPLPPAPRPVRLPEADEEVTNESVLGFAEGQSFMIEYVDAGGFPSSRRISVWAIKQSERGYPSLLAHCHERQALRQFRVDRIRCCIDFDGEVHDDVPVFMRNTFGMDLPFLLEGVIADDSDRWKSILASVRHDCVLLTMMVRADGLIHTKEILRVLDHLEHVAERDGLFLIAEECEALKAYLKRMRPRKDAIDRALRAVHRRAPHHVVGLFRVMAEVMDADGRRHADEIRMMNRLAEEMLGMAIF